MNNFDKISSKIISILKPISNIINIPTDKIAHFIVGFILQIGIALIFDIKIGFISVFIIAVLKEIYDNYSPNHVADVNDIFATILGSVVGIVLFVVGGVK